MRSARTLCARTRPFSINTRFNSHFNNLNNLTKLNKPHRRTFFSSSSFSSSGSSGNAGSTQAAHSQMGPLAGVMQELDGVAPRFEVGEGDVEVLEGPVEFFDCLKRKISQAKRRIFLATLYIGKEEHELIETVQQALRKNPQLKISFLTDALRGTRESPKPTTASLLAPLISEFGSERVQIRMFHTPNLVGARRKLIPKRINEGWGLQHMKLYGVDDEIIMSGANLSKDYFTNRQDRYHVLKSAELTEYYHAIHRAVADLSYDILPSKNKAGYEKVWPLESPAPDPILQPRGFKWVAHSILNQLIRPGGKDLVFPDKPATDTGKATTYIYPLFQLTPLLPSPKIKDPTTSTEYPALVLLLENLARKPLVPSRWTFTAGYFNPSPNITSLLLSTCKPTQSDGSPSNPTAGQTNGTVITAHPHANGFFNSSGISSLLPPAYTLLAHRFLQAAHAQSLSSQINMLEWRRGLVGTDNGWTYHAKGLWVTLVSSLSTSATGASDQEAKFEEGPSISLIGSSNYTLRSQTLDLEANALILTRSPALQRRLRQEEVHLAEHAARVGLDEYAKDERKVGWHVRLAMWCVTVVGVAL